MSQAAELESIERLTENWEPEAKARAFRELANRTSSERKVWFCKYPGRLCDGKPHEGYPYPHARGKQWPPATNSWDTWLVMAGRGFGKTRVAAEWTRQVSGKVPRINLVGRTNDDVRATMVEGESSGLIAVCERAGVSFDWKPALKTFTFGNGCIVRGFSAEEPDKLRGPQSGAAWLDEPAHMDLIDDVWDNLQYGLRLPGLPGGAKAVCTTTPLPIKWVKARVKEEGEGTVVTRGHTDENADNLDDSYKRRVIEKHRGTRKGRQELAGELLEDVPGALWQLDLLRPVTYEFTPSDWQEFDRIVVSIDPAGTANRRSDLTGLVVVGKIDGRYYVLADRSGKYSPKGWADEADKLYQTWHADAIIAEKNFGGDMVKETVEGSGTRARVKVNHAARSKQLRAEPIVALYERRLVLHNLGVKITDEGAIPALADLEEEMLTWVPGHGDSPNRVDALVWGLDELSGGAGETSMASPADHPEAARITPLMPAGTKDLDAMTRLILPVGFRRRL